MNAVNFKGRILHLFYSTFRRQAERSEAQAAKTFLRRLTPRFLLGGQGQRGLVEGIAEWYDGGAV